MTPWHFLCLRALQVIIITDSGRATQNMCVLVCRGLRLSCTVSNIIKFCLLAGNDVLAVSPLEGTQVIYNCAFWKGDYIWDAFIILLQVTWSALTCTLRTQVSVRARIIIILWRSLANEVNLITSIQSDHFQCTKATNVDQLMCPYVDMVICSKKVFHLIIKAQAPWNVQCYHAVRLAVVKATQMKGKHYY